MSGWNEQMLLALAPSPWQPLSARAKPPETTTKKLRGWLLGGVALLHLLVFAILLPLLDRHYRLEQDDAIAVDFLDEPPPMQVVPNETVTIRMPKTEEKAAQAKPRARESQPVSKSALPRVPPTAVDLPMQVVDTKPSKKLQLFNRDGSMHLPENMLDEIDKKYGDKRTFSWQIPHYEDADKYFKRNPALVYEETRFDQYWTPDEDVLTSFLRKAVEATTVEAKIKVPGTNGSSQVVCKIAILAAGGACGVLTNGADWNGPQDDPNTLNPEEQRQCAAWWQKIVNAKTQDAWHATKKLYERECRKPLLDPARG